MYSLIYFPQQSNERGVLIIPHFRDERIEAEKLYWSWKNQLEDYSGRKMIRVRVNAVALEMNRKIGL